jgi:hypothetical protein
MSDVFYNGQNVMTANLGVISAMSRSVDPVRYGTQWAQKEVFQIVGQLTGICTGDFAGLVAKTSQLVNNFTPDFQTMQIYDGASLVEEKTYCRITNINIDSNKFYRAVPFTVTLESYNEDAFSGVFGVINPSNEINYSEQPDGTVEITHTVSAGGFNTSNGASNALQNAQYYVESQSSFIPQNIIEPIFIQYSNLAPCLKSVEEIVDRFNATYSLVKRYTLNEAGQGYPTLNLTANINYNEEQGFYTVDLNGSVVGCMDLTLAETRAYFLTLDLYALALTALIRSTNENVSLNPNYLNKDINEVDQDNSITFSISYTSDVMAGNAYFEFDTTTNYEDLPENYTVNLQGTIKGYNGQKARWDHVLGVYDSLDLVAICNSALVDEYGGSITLNPYPTSYNVDFNERAATVSISISFQNLKYPYINDFRDMKYTVSIVPIIDLQIPIQTLNNGTKIFDIESKLRGKISVQGTAVSVDSADQTANLKNISKSIIANYFNQTFLESNTVEKTIIGGDKGDSYNFNAVASFGFEDFPSNLFELP